ncbi:hypothetical protein [Desulfacinum hydrothermale]|uniref:hypothetical protein n=1 Tax=Desulfacinum hydrothermale TaxID=109258 RepID=UPI00111C84A4|nr:hypothetical protein [Desulfacinum hydrothermale]
MTRKILKTGLLLTLVIFVVFPLGSVFAQQKIKPIQKPSQNKAFPLKLKADLEIFGIGNKTWEGSECSACSNILTRVGALYLHDLTVGIMCHSSNRVKKTGGTVRVTYYDLIQGKNITISKRFSNLSCQTQPRDTLVTLVNHPILIKLSTGIRAIVSPSAPIEDSNPVNNRMTTNDPNKMCINNIVY